MPFSLRVSLQHSSVAHIDRRRHITDRQRAAEVKPSLPFHCVCLGVEVNGDKQKTTCAVYATNLQLIIQKTKS